MLRSVVSFDLLHGNFNANLVQFMAYLYVYYAEKLVTPGVFYFYPSFNYVHIIACRRCV